MLGSSGFSPLGVCSGSLSSSISFSGVLSSISGVSCLSSSTLSASISYLGGVPGSNLICRPDSKSGLTAGSVGWLTSGLLSSKSSLHSESTSSFFSSGGGARISLLMLGSQSLSEGGTLLSDLLSPLGVLKLAFSGSAISTTLRSFSSSSTSISSLGMLCWLRSTFCVSELSSAAGFFWWFRLERWNWPPLALLLTSSGIGLLRFSC